MVTGEEEQEVEYPLLRTYTIFSASQISGPNLDRFHTDVPAISTFVDYEPAEQAIAAIRCHGNERTKTKRTPSKEM